MRTLTFIIQDKIDYYDRCIVSCLEYIADKKPRGKDLLLLKEQRILYIQFRDELINIRNIAENYV